MSPLTDGDGDTTGGGFGFVGPAPAFPPPPPHAERTPTVTARNAKGRYLMNHPTRRGHPCSGSIARWDAQFRPASPACCASKVFAPSAELLASRITPFRSLRGLGDISHRPASSQASAACAPPRREP